MVLKLLLMNKSKLENWTERIQVAKENSELQLYRAKSKMEINEIDRLQQRVFWGW
jgi:hypothetical protein